MGMMRFESQEYTLQGRMQFFAKLYKIRLFEASSSWRTFKNCQTTYRRNNRLCAQELIQLTTEISGYSQVSYFKPQTHDTSKQQTEK